MPEFIKTKCEDTKTGLNLDYMIAYDLTEGKDKEPFLSIDFAAPMPMGPGQPGGFYRRTFEGKQAKDIGKYLESLGLDVPPKR